MHIHLSKTMFCGPIAAAVALSACGGDSTPVAAPVPAANSAAPAATPAPAAQAANLAAGFTSVTSGQTAIGDVLVGTNGLTLYGFKNDADAKPACYGTCAEAWPPVIVDSSWDVAPGLDSGVFNAVVRDDGQLQLVAGKWPLYYFAGDAIAGDVNGQGSGDVWFAAGTDGTLLTEPAPAGSAQETQTGPIVDIATTSLGDALVDGSALTLYGFLEDEAGNPTCEEACADAWPPLLVDSAELPADLDAEVFSVVQRNDGSFQLKAGKWPLYRFAGDAAAGDVNGQGSGDVWFVAAPGGGLIKNSEATDDGGTPAPAPAAEKSPATTEKSKSGYGY